MAISFVSRKGTTGPGGATPSTGAQAHGAGHLLVAVMQAQTSGATLTAGMLSNTAGDVWVVPAPATGQSNGGANYEYVAYVLNTAGHASDVVTVNWGAASYSTIACYEFSTTAAPFSFVATAMGQGSGTAIATSALTLAQASAIIAQMEHDGGATPTAGAGYAIFSSDGGAYISDEYHIAPSSEAATCTAGSAAAWGIIAAAFTDAGGGGGGGRGLFRAPSLSGIGGGGSFFRDPLQAPMAQRMAA